MQAVEEEHLHSPLRRPEVLREDLTPAQADTGWGCSETWPLPSAHVFPPAVSEQHTAREACSEHGLCPSEGVWLWA